MPDPFPASTTEHAYVTIRYQSFTRLNKAQYHTWVGSMTTPETPDHSPEQPSSTARRKASKALAGRCTARLRAPVSLNVPVWFGGMYVKSDRPTREKLPTTCVHAL